MRRVFYLLITVFLAVETYAQCTIVPFSLQKKVYSSDVIVEGTVIAKESFWNDDQDVIHTKNTIQVFSILKGNTVPVQINLITEGGRVGMDMMVVEPSLQVNVGETGVFLLRNSDLKFTAYTGTLYQPVASVQSFIKYDLANGYAHGYFEKYEGIESNLIPKIEEYTSQQRKKIGKGPGLEYINKLATPVISSIDKDTVTSGTYDLLTITGSNFGIIQGSGYVEFLDPNYGDGRFYPVNYPSSYTTWTNSKIQVYVPSRAGTGKIRVVNNSQEATTSSSKIYVKYAISSYPYPGSTGVDSGFYAVRHIDLSGNGGYRWQMSTNFAGKTAAVNAFLRAAENWRCSTLMNWDVGNNTSVQEVKKDNVNVVQFTNFGDSRLGVCTSWYSGCLQSGKATFYVSELDISFDSTRNWYYGTGTPGKSQYDFETVATHELGHGHQLSHVIDDTKIMHYSLSNGDRKTVLHSDDKEGGNYVSDLSKSGSVCSKGTYTPVTQGDCNITRPKAALSVNIPSPCPGTSVKFTDETEGKVNTYAWDFGQDASTATATGQGPHTLSYSSSGEKTITLIATNDFGSDTAYLKMTVQPGPPDTPQVFITDTACLGISTYQIAGVENAKGYEWSLASGGSITGGNKDTVATVNWTTTGTHMLSVKANNTCGVGPAREQAIVVIEPAVADFSFIDDGLDYSFTDLSTGATSWLWRFSLNDSSMDQNATYSYTSRGIYDVSLTVMNACSDSTVIKQVDVKFRTGINEVVATQPHLVPNPTREYVEVSNVFGQYNLLIMNNLGQVVVDMTSLTPGEKVDVKHLDNGVYFYTIETQEGITTSGKLVKAD